MKIAIGISIFIFVSVLSYILVQEGVFKRLSESLQKENNATGQDPAARIPNS